MNGNVYELIIMLFALKVVN